MNDPTPYLELPSIHDDCVPEDFWDFPVLNAIDEEHIEHRVSLMDSEGHGSQPLPIEPTTRYPCLVAGCKSGPYKYVLARCHVHGLIGRLPQAEERPEDTRPPAASRVGRRRGAHGAGTHWSRREGISVSRPRLPLGLLSQRRLRPTSQE
jgi:hypothetical protein